MSRTLVDSGIDWLKEIHYDWKISKISQKYSLRATKVSDRDYEPLSVTYGGVVPQLENVAKTDAHDERKLVKKDDFVINSRSDRRGACGIADRDGSVSLINIVLEPNDNMVAKYYEFLFHSVQFGEEFYKWGHGIVDDLWTTRWQDMKKISIPVPPLSEQQSIADYLDTKTAEIDAAITTAKELIDKYKAYKQSVITEAVTKGLNHEAKMKDSGIDWIGDIPEHWDTMPNKYIMYKVKEIQNKYKGEDIISLSVDGVKVRDLEAGGKIPTSFDGYQKIKPNRLLMCLFDMDVTPRCIGIINDEGLTSPAYSQFAMTPNAYAPYFYYYYLSLDYDKTLVHLAKNLRHSLTEDQLGAIGVVVPPLSEQQSIANYLDDKCSQINTVIAQKEQLVRQLQEYKKSIIYEYVTGKKEVQNG